jgi:hypothetical protein
MSNNDTLGNKSFHDRQIKFIVPVFGVCGEKEENATREKEVALNTSATTRGRDR